MSKTRVGIINVTGYAGSELARILHRHPDVDIAQVTGRSTAGKQLSEVFPHLLDADMTISASLDSSVDLVFSALPHAASAEALSPFIEEDVPCVDISADFRLKDVNVFEKWYKTPHPCPQYIENAVYGLPELHREDVKRTRLIANPGCYPTGTILGLAPAFNADIVTPDVISDSKSGLSGAGRKADIAYNFNEINDNMSAYGLTGHRHMPEMSQELTALSRGRNRENKGTKKGPTRIRGGHSNLRSSPRTHDPRHPRHPLRHPQTRNYPPTSHRTLPRLLRRRALRPSGLIGPIH